MGSNSSRSCFAALLAASLFALTPPATAQQHPGVGYDPQARGLTVSSYQLDTLTSPFLHHTADFTAQPGEVGQHPDPYHLDFADAAVRQAFELRWGPLTTTSRFKRWIGPGNEVKFLLRDALAWYFQTHPDQLGGDTANRNGEPTEVEVTDVQAFGDRLWVAYFQSELEGFSAERRVTLCDPNKPVGDGEEKDPFWGIPFFFHNTFQPPPPVSPQVPGTCPQT